MKREPPPVEDTNLVKFLQAYAGTPPPPHPHLEQRIVQAALHQHQLSKRRWQIVSLLGAGVIATATSVWFLKPSTQVAKQTSPDAVAIFITTNWQAMFQDAEPAIFD
ncbi:MULTISPECIES: hypothetical protein [unclassified Thermosynechococcus]|uniref:hypothetical protein n=1 Tax=unclassified Thermosynechococcus TaxID=2622553 RepID=UPI002877FB97|nr:MULTISPECIES: hypothetical protein [unclassified Thermosynechococcus]WNC52838.1 hypothetical protein RHJ02_00495 [Thermosynechococcus sp. TG215]WNC57929.1 hypothetical protein RHJ13_00500 [Thermosynechococcus sp. TG218]